MAIERAKSPIGGNLVPETLLTHVRTLAGEIGPRGMGTTGEAQVARYVRERLQELGLPAEGNISAEALLQAAEFTRGLLQELDGRTGR
jgi:hypothetical protein